MRVFGTNQIVDTKEKTDLYIPFGNSFERSIKLQIKSKTFFNYRFPQTDQLGSIQKMKDLKGYFLFYDKDTNKICKLNGTIFADSDDVMKSFDGYGGKSSFEVATIEEIKMELFKIVNDYDRIFADSDDVMKSFDGYGGKSSFEVATIEEIKMELFKIVNDYDRIK